MLRPLFVTPALALVLAASPLPAQEKPNPTPPAGFEPTEVQNPLVPSPGFWSNYPPGWAGRHKTFNETSKKDAAKIRIVFFGDSLTEKWASEGKSIWNAKFAPAGAVNYGIGGDGVQQLQWRLDHGNLDGLKPQWVVLMIGANNFFGGKNGTPEEIAQAIQKLIADIRKRSPFTRILLLSTLPVKNSADNPHRVGIARLNELLAPLNGKNGVTYLDVAKNFINPDKSVKGDLYVDYAHLSPAGYEVLAAKVVPALGLR